MHKGQRTYMHLAAGDTPTHLGPRQGRADAPHLMIGKGNALALSHFNNVAMLFHITWKELRFTGPHAITLGKKK